jgi:hypothetical protein
MFCCMCGARNLDNARLCHNCTAPFEAHSLPPSNSGYTQPLSSRDLENPEVQGLIRLSKISQKPGECHSCGKRENLTSFQFGLAKPLSTERDWRMTAASVLVSAVSVPLVGFGVLQLPGKKTNMRVMRLRLVLCRVCWTARKGYALHPWWAIAQESGYTVFITAEELSTLQPA